MNSLVLYVTISLGLIILTLMNRYQDAPTSNALSDEAKPSQQQLARPMEVEQAGGQQKLNGLMTNRLEVPYAMVELKGTDDMMVFPAYTHLLDQAAYKEIRQSNEVKSNTIMPSVNHALLLAMGWTDLTHAHGYGESTVKK